MASPLDQMASQLGDIWLVACYPLVSGGTVDIQTMAHLAGLNSWLTYATGAPVVDVDETTWRPVIRVRRR